jgi:hypothetical protein
MNLSELTLEAVQPLLGTVFQLALDEGGTLELKLIDAAPFEMPRRVPRGLRQPKRAAFAIYFLGPYEPVVPQRMYTLRGETESFEGLFIVPVGRDEEGTEYEAVFA